MALRESAGWREEKKPARTRVGREGSEYIGIHKVENLLELLPHDSETVFVQVPAQGCIGKEGIQRGEELQDLGLTDETIRYRR